MLVQAQRTRRAGDGDGRQVLDGHLFRTVVIVDIRVVVVPGPRIDVPELEQLVAVDRIVPVAGREAAVLLEHLRMGADHDRLVLGHVAQVLPEPVGDLVAQPQFVGFRGVLASVEDVVHEDVVHVADIGRIAGRTEVHLEIDRAQRIAQDGRLVVVVVADDVEGRRVHPLRIVDIGVVDVHVVVDQVAEVDAVARLRMRIMAGMTTER